MDAAEDGLRLFSPAVTSTPLAKIDARAKLAGLIGFLIAVATTPTGKSVMVSVLGSFIGYAAILFIALVASRLPISMVLLRAAAVLPFSATFALFTWWSAGPAPALVIVEKSFLSALAVVMVMAATPLPEIARAMAWFRMPAMLVLVLQFLYRYLWVTAGQARTMQMAARGRAGLRSGSGLRLGFQSAAGAVGVLFARSSERAEGIYQAMLSRGFTGSFPSPMAARFGLGDAAFLAAFLMMIAGAAIAVRVWF